MKSQDLVLEDKVILLISPQPWSDMYISKHHYAIELAKRNNTVYFVNPVRDERKLNLEISTHKSIANLHLVQLSSYIPYWFKFHWRWLFNLFLNWHIKRLVKKIDKKIDIVWDFDCNNLYQNLDLFKAKLKVFHPVDQSVYPLPESKKPDVIFSVSNEILSFYRNVDIPKYFINHGISGAFLRLANERIKSLGASEPNRPLQAAYIGNLMIPEINYSVILESIRAKPEVEFHFYGPYSEDADAASTEIIEYIKQLKTFSNVYLHGLKTQHFIADVVKNVDLFFYCYQTRPGYNADNSHKILEYLGTGKVIVGSPLKVYAALDLFPQASTDKDWNELFSSCIENISALNQIDHQTKRIEFALQNTYDQHLNTIQTYLSKLSPTQHQPILMVIVSCSGKFHAFALAEQLERLALLEGLYTSFSARKNTWAKNFNARIDSEQIPTHKIHTNLWVAAGLKLYKHPPSWNDIFDQWVAQRLKKNCTEYKLFIGWSGMSLQSIRVAKDQGKITVLERGSSHIQYQDKMLRAEYARFGIDFQVYPAVLAKELKEYEEADYISIPSTFVKDSFLEYGIPEEKLLLNPYGTSNLFQIKEPFLKDDTFRILYLGRLSIRKGLIYLLEALHQISLQYKNIEAHFIGSIDPAVQKIIDNFEGIRDNWHFFGHLPQQELPQYIGRCDVAVHPSLEEGLSTVIPQILSCGVPVIATTNTGGEDIISEAKTGYIVPIRSSAAIAEKIRYLIENPKTLEELKENNRSQHQHYNWDHYGDNWGACINTLLTDKR